MRMHPNIKKLSDIPFDLEVNCLNGSILQSINVW